MQSIAEEVVSTSGGGGKYITSGFSAYNGHSAIGFAYYITTVGGNFDDRENYEFMIGILNENGILEGYGWHRDSTLGSGWDTITSCTPNYAIVF